MARVIDQGQGTLDKVERLMGRYIVATTADTVAIMVKGYEERAEIATVASGGVRRKFLVDCPDGTLLVTAGVDCRCTRMGESRGYFDVDYLAGI